MRRTREIAPKVPLMSLVRVCKREMLAVGALEAGDRAPAMPIALRISALRAFESAMVLRAMTAWCVAPLSRRVITSVTMVRIVRTKAPAKVSAPSIGCRK